MATKITKTHFPTDDSDEGSGLEAVLAAMQDAICHDFHCYKRPTLARRTRRRMALHRLDSYDDYARMIRAKRDEATALRKDLLIGVAEFFRPSEAWSILEEKVIAGLVKNARPRSILRVWVPACSTGKEAYSVAMLMVEHMERSGKKLRLQVFATDIDPSAVDSARSGLYTQQDLKGLSAERLARFCIRKDGRYEIVKKLRNMMAFAPQDLMADPPFSHLDLVTCRNLLIYLDQAVQRKLIRLLHFALRDGGYLFLGSAETTCGEDDLFEPVSRKWRIYRKIGGTTAIDQLELSNEHLKALNEEVTSANEELQSINEELETSKEALQTLNEELNSVNQRLQEKVVEMKQTEAKLGYLASFPARNPNPVMEVDMDGRIRYLNAATERLFPDLPERGAEHPYLADWAAVVQTFRDRLVNASSREIIVGERAFEQLFYFIAQDRIVRIYGHDITDRKRAEDEARKLFNRVQEERDKLSSLINSISDEVWFADTARRFTLANPSALREFGGSAADMMDVEKFVESLEVYRPDGTPRPVEEAPPLRALRGEFVSNNDEIVRTPATGELRYRQVSAAPVRNASGDIVGSVSVVRDITDRKRAEQAVSDGEDRLRFALETSHTGAWDLDLVNHTAFRSLEHDHVFGYAELLPQWTYEMFLEHVLPEDRAEVNEKFSHAVATHGDWSFECRIRRADGEVRWICAAGRPRTEKSGGGYRMAGIVQDITERKLTELAWRLEKEQSELRVLERTAELTEAMKTIRQTGAYTRSLIEASMDPLVTIGRDGTITDVNTATETATGRARQELIGTDFSTYFTEPEMARKGYRQVFNEGSVRDYPLEIRHREGHTIPVLYNASLYRDEAGQVVGIFAAARDITERQRAELALREANEQLAGRAAQLRALAGELTLTEQRERRRLAKVLHDHLQQLLVGAKFRAAIMGRSGDEIIRKGAAEIEGLLDESINASRSLTAELSPPILHEAGLLSGLKWLARWMADKHGLVVDLAVDQDVPPLVEDVKILLFESVRELLFNAVKHARVHTAAVNVRLIEGKVLHIIVSDSGPGFDPAGLKPAGTIGGGFGLFSIGERLDLIGGKIEIQSKPGEGSRIVLVTPIANAVLVAPKPGFPAAARGTDRHVASKASLIRGAKIRVMLADDHAVMRQGLASLLGAEPDIEIVAQASDGEEAVQLAGKLAPDVILIDMSMPKLNGVEATRAILRHHPGIRIIGLTMFEESEHAQAMRDAGAVNYLTKSVPAADLFASIRACAADRGRGPNETADNTVLD